MDIFKLSFNGEGKGLSNGLIRRDLWGERTCISSIKYLFTISIRSYKQLRPVVFTLTIAMFVFYYMNCQNITRRYDCEHRYIFHTCKYFNTYKHKKTSGDFFFLSYLIVFVFGNSLRYNETYPFAYQRHILIHICIGTSSRPTLLEIKMKML